MRFATMVFSGSMLCVSCFNPFAPTEGEVGSRTWSDQNTVGGLLNNFALSYDYRDSLRYADCLASSFVFHYWDVENGRYDSWTRETDLKATGGMFRSYDHIDLEWNMIPAEVETFDRLDSSLSFIVHFNLTIGNEVPLMGFARFEVKADDDGRFRVMVWRDDF